MRRAISAMLGTLLLLGLGMALGSRAFAQAPTTGTLRVTVVDPSGAVIVGSTVVVTNVEQSTNGAAIEPVKTSGPMSGAIRKSGGQCAEFPNAD